MRIKISPNVDKHKYNPNYPVVIVEFDIYDEHFNWHRREWLPKSIEVLALAKVLASVDEQFRQDCIDNLMLGDNQ